MDFEEDNLVSAFDTDSILTVTDSLDRPKPFTGTFFSRDSYTAVARAAYLKTYLTGSALTMLTVCAILSIYWGALYHSASYNLVGWIVDFDDSLVGQNVSQALAGPKGRISWRVIPSAKFPHGSAVLANAVVEQECWVAIAINAGATDRLRDALTSANESYDGTTAITVFAVEARDENAYRTIIKPSFESALQQTTHQFAVNISKIFSPSPNPTNLLSTRPDLGSQLNSPKLAVLSSKRASFLNVETILYTAPQIVIQPVSYTISNLRPFDVAIASAVTFVGVIYLTTLSHIVVVAAYTARESSGLDSLLTFSSMVCLRLVSIATVFLFISLFYSLLSLMFQLPFDRKFGQADGFIIFWMVNWFGMLAVSLAFEALVTLLTPRYLGFFYVLVIVANISVSFLPLDIQPRIFRYGYASPYYNISQAVRSIIFRTKNTVGLNFGVLLVWVTISCVSLTAIQWWIRRRRVKAWTKAEEEEKTGI